MIIVLSILYIANMLLENLGQLYKNKWKLLATFSFLRGSCLFTAEQGLYYSVGLIFLRLMLHGCLMNVGETSYLVSSTYESTMRVGTLLNINTNHTILSRGNIHYMHVSLFHLMLHVNCSMLSMYQVARAPCAWDFWKKLHLRRVSKWNVPIPMYRPHL